MAEIYGVFEVNASHPVTIQADVEGLTPEQIADLLYEGDPGISICHQCADDISDPEPGDLVGFSVGDSHYEIKDGRWVREGGDPR